MTKQTIKTLDVTITAGGQKAHFVELLTLADHKLRVRIESDSYKDQSFAVIERWSGSKWEAVWSILPGVMQTAPKLAYTKPKPSAGDFVEDRDRLVARAIEVLR